MLYIFPHGSIALAVFFRVTATFREKVHVPTVSKAASIFQFFICDQEMVLTNQVFNFLGPRISKLFPLSFKVHKFFIFSRKSEVRCANPDQDQLLTNTSFPEMNFSSFYQHCC